MTRKYKIWKIKESILRAIGEEISELGIIVMNSYRKSELTEEDVTPCNYVFTRGEERVVWAVIQVGVGDYPDRDLYFVVQEKGLGKFFDWKKKLIKYARKNYGIICEKKELSHFSTK